MNSRLQAILDYSIVVMIAGMIVTTVSSTKIPSLLFYILIAASCLNWFVHYKKGTSTQGVELKQHKTLFLLCSVSLIAVLASKIVHLSLSGTEIEKAVRFSVGLPLLYAGLRFIPYERLKHALWGVYVAILFQFGYVLSVIEPNSARPITSDIHNAVSYAVICLLLTVLSVFTLGIQLSNKSKLEQVFKSIIVALGVVTFLLLQTRTGVVALPVFVFLFVLVFFYKMSIVKKLMVFMLGVAVVVVGALVLPSMQQRAEQAVSEFNKCIDSGLSIDSSVCIRMQLSKAAVLIWQEQPIFGTGDNSAFQEKMKTGLLERGVVTKYTAENFGEPHNDYTQALSSFGVVGIIGLILLYFAPGWFSFRRIISDLSLKQRCLAGMGAATCFGFAVFGLTELMFRNMRTVSFYTTLVILFIVLLDVLLIAKQKNRYSAEYN